MIHRMSLVYDTTDVEMIKSYLTACWIELSTQEKNLLKTTFENIWKKIIQST